MLPLADRAIIASREIVLLRNGLPPDFQAAVPCMRSISNPKSDEAPKSLSRGSLSPLTVSTWLHSEATADLKIFDVHTLQPNLRFPA